MQVDFFCKQGNIRNKKSSCDNCIGIGRDRFSVPAF